MRRLVAMLLLTLASGSAAAGWVMVGKTETSTLYADSYMPQVGDVVTMWNMSDLNASAIFSKAGPTFSAVIRQEEFNCKEERARTLYFELNTRNMGKGDIVYSRQTPTGWTKISPAGVDSGGGRPTDRLYFELACRKR